MMIITHNCTFIHHFFDLISKKTSKTCQLLRQPMETMTMLSCPWVIQTPTMVIAKFLQFKKINLKQKKNNLLKWHNLPPTMMIFFILIGFLSIAIAKSCPSDLPCNAACTVGKNEVFLNFNFSNVLN